MKWINNMKIRKKLIISYLLACIIPLVVTTLIIYRISAKSLEETSLELASVFSSQIGKNLDDFIDEYSRVTKTVLIDNETIYLLDKNKDSSITEKVNLQINLRKIMMRLTTMKPEIKSIYFLTAEDQFYQFNNEGSSVDKEILKEEIWIKDVLKSEDQLVLTAVHSRAYCDLNPDEIVITVGRKIMDFNGSYVGMLLIDIDPSSVIELSDGFLATRNQYNIKISITDNQNRIFYDSDVASGRTTWKGVMSGENSIQDEEVKQNFITLTSETKKAGLKIHVQILKSNLLFQINKIGHTTTIAIVSCILVIIIISYLFSKRITSPIEGLQKSMGRVGKGEYEEIQTIKTNDEIGSLIKSYNCMIVKIKNLIEEVFIADIKQKNARYLALKTQINPHMLYNTLESIRMKAIMNGDDDVANMIKNLAKMFRISFNDNANSHKIRNEIEYVENYINLQNMRYPDQFSICVDIDDHIRDAKIISMIFQPIIENSIIHGFKGYGKELQIIISGKQTSNNEILIHIKDNGKGMSFEGIQKVNAYISNWESHKLILEETEEEDKSIGLQNIAERIKLYYGNSYYLKVLPCLKEGINIEILIPGLWDEKCD